MASSASKKRKPENSAGLLKKFTLAVSTMQRETQEAMKDAWEELGETRRKEILAIPLIAFSLISFLAMITYDPADLVSRTARAAASVHSTQNWIGMPGAWLAHGIISILGASGFALPPLFLLWGVDRLRVPVRSVRKIRILGCLVLLSCISSLSGLLTDFTMPMDDPSRAERIWQASGAVGYLVSRRLLELGPMGALIVNLSVMAASGVVCTPFLFTHFFTRISEFLFPTRLDEEETTEYGGERGVISLEPLNEDSRSGRRQRGGGLPPIQEWEGNAAELSYPEGNWEDEEREDLPPLNPLETRGELKIVTSEDEPLREVDLGVNLVKTPDNVDYQLPPIHLLDKPEATKLEIGREEILYYSAILERTLADFNIPVKVVEVNYGPTITCYELEPAPGIKISRIENLNGDITRSLKAECVRIVAPIPGKGTVGVEVPNRTRSDVYLREIIASETYQSIRSKLKVGLGKTISGEPYIIDLVKAPHLLVAGATGSGKSVCINTIISSILFNAAPHEVKLLLVDPKQVELALYRDIPHLLSPVITDPKKAGAALRWAVEEMETRYRYLKKAGVRHITEYNKKRMAQQQGSVPETESSLVFPGFLPYIVIIIDELADLMIVVRVEVESEIARLAAMARAGGIHLGLAPQRPSVDVLTGGIKNNFPSRIAFQVSSLADSRTIMDMKGAESLLGRGDMLVSNGGAGKPIRLQCSYVSTEEVEDIVAFVKEQQDVEYVQEEFTPLEEMESVGLAGGEAEDDLYEQALQIVLENDSASTSLLQRRLKIGYGRAARLLDLMEENNIVGPPQGSKPRKILMNHS